MKSTGIEWDKLPAVIEAPGYSKATDEWKLTISTPSKYRDPYVIALHARMGQVGVFFFVPCGSIEEAEALLQGDDRPSPLPSPQKGRGGKSDRHFVSVELMAQVLGVDPRTVQLDAEKGLLVRTARGQYDTLASCGTLRKALRAAESGQNDAYAEERTKSMRLKRQERELDYLERAKKLGNVEIIQRVMEKAKAAERQQVLFMPKQLAPRLEGNAAEREAMLEEWAYAFLKGQTELNLSADLAGAPKPDLDRMPGLKSKGVSRKARKGRKGKTK